VSEGEYETVEEVEIKALSGMRLSTHLEQLDIDICTLY
jgi:hypothetical protein